MGLLGKKSPQHTVLILDIENGSVGSVLARLRQDEAPELFGERRVAVPLMDTRSALSLARAVEHAASDALLYASEVAARLRHRGSAPLGSIDKVVVFMAAPWGTPNLVAGRPDFSAALVDLLYPRIATLLGNVPIALHAHASAAIHGLRALYPQEPHALLLSVNGEVSELLLVKDSRVVGHATAPVGLHTVLRTLRSHAGLNEHEARSALRLNHKSEALDAAAKHFAAEFRHVAGELFAGEPSPAVFVLAHEPGSEWFARTLEMRSLADLFPRGGVVRAIRAAHVAPYVSTANPDLHLGLNALYASAAHSYPR